MLEETRIAGSRSPTRIDQMVGEKIRELRTTQNFTLSELGLELGISHQQLQKYETGTNRLSAGMLAYASGFSRLVSGSGTRSPVRAEA